MTRKKVYLCLLLMMVLLGALGVGYYLWQKRDIRPLQGTLVLCEQLKERVMNAGKDVIS